jgi:hypothetical protein
MMSSVHIGLNGEAWVMEQLRKRGYAPTIPKYHAPYDLVVDNVPIEVKTARPTKRVKDGRTYTRWQWHIHPTTYDAIQGDWVLILIAQDSTGHRHPYIVPGGIAEPRNQLQITRHPDEFTGWLSAWLNKWDVIDYLSQQIYEKNGPLFQQWEKLER